MKPSISFLLKVRDGGVRWVKSYKAARGGYYYWKGGELTAKRHIAGGFVHSLAIPDLGHASTAELTAKGMNVLRDAGHKPAAAPTGGGGGEW